MYNRYIPQSDGTYRRNPIADSRKQGQRDDTVSSVPHPDQNGKPDPVPFSPPRPHEYSSAQKSPPPPVSVSGFLRNLLPKDFDTGDLMVIILLLLISADSSDDQNSALLTLALYLFM